MQKHNAEQNALIFMGMISRACLTFGDAAAMAIRAPPKRSVDAHCDASLNERLQSGDARNRSEGLRNTRATIRAYDGRVARVVADAHCALDGRALRQRRRRSYVRTSATPSPRSDSLRRSPAG